VSGLLDSVGVDRFRHLIHQRTGISHPEARVGELAHSIKRAATELRLRDTAELYELLAEHDERSDALDALLSALNVSETYFFRDSRQLEIVEQRILPELIERRAAHRRLRLWSAGCSTGEEAYTLAIIVARLLRNRPPWDVTILATDINERSLERARSGEYRAWSLRGCTPIDLAPDLVRDGSGFRVAPSIQTMVRFATLNLAQPVYPSLTTGTDAVDLILCRNVVMYFSENARREALERLAAALAPGGFLLTSQVEAGVSDPVGLVLDRPGDAVYRKPDQTARRTTEAGQARRPRTRTRPARPVIREARRRRALLTPARTPEINSAHRGLGMPISEADSKAVVRHRRQALARWREGFVDEATEELSQAAERHPLSAPLHYLHGLILLDTGRADEALTALRRCTYADPSCAPAHLVLACACSRLGMRGRARAALATASRLAAELSPEDRIDACGLGELTVAEMLELIAAQQQLLLAGEQIHTPSFAMADEADREAGFHAR
jgi:chemotaxis protein methyltransferase CheR